MNARRQWLMLTVGIACLVFALVSVIYHVRAEARPAAALAATQDSEEQPTAKTASVVSFVKDPQPAPAFELRDLSGNVVSSANWKGKVVVLNFWATWCPPCREEIPEMIQLQNDYKDRLVIIGVSEDEDPPEKVLEFVKQKGINYPVVMATPELIEKYGGVAALPTSFVIDTQGGVVQKHIGLYPIENYNAEIRALLGRGGDTRIETFVDNGQIFLKNAANATELPGVDFSGLSAEQKKAALHELNSENCTCGCNLTLAECRINDTTCPISSGLAAKVVEKVRNAPAKPKSAAARSAANHTTP